MTSSKQTTDGGDVAGYTTGYTYKLSGALDEETYPSGRVVKNVLNQNGDLSIVESKKNASFGYFNYAKNFTYTSAGAVSSMQLGNGKWESTVFNSRLQPTQIALGTTPGTTDKLKLNFDYGSTANNGNVQSQTITVPGLAQPFVQNYAYDELNRLSSATETNNGSQTWNQVYGFDRYGNRNITSGTGVTSLTFNSSNNRITTSGYSYDTAGNTTADPTGKTYTYDAENKQTLVNSGSVGQYWYDGDGKRVKKYVPGTGETTVFVYDAGGKQIAEYSTIVYTGTDAKVAYTTSDHLGSPRINTDANGVIIARHDYLPFGEELTPGMTAQRTSGTNYVGDTNRKQFTGYERDIESDLDFAQARMYAKSLGRFSASDPYNIIFEKEAGRDNREKAKIFVQFLSQPQNWNRYVYVLNNPANLVDPLGLIYLQDSNNILYYVDNNFYRENKGAIEKLIGKFTTLADGARVTVGQNATGMFAKFKGQTVVLGTGGLLIPVSSADSVGARSSDQSAEHGNSQSDSVTARPSARLRMPDFYQGEADIPLIGFGGAAIQTTYDRSGRFYFGVGGYLGFGGVDFSGGYLPQRYRAYSHETENFLTGASVGVFLPSGLGGTYSNNHQFAPQIGTGGANISATYGVRVPYLDIPR